jgi:16S rRNA (guanine527-N7)-methyltransferase
LQDCGLEPAAAARLEAYLDRLAAWSVRVNLTGARTPEERVALLVAPVLPLAPVVESPLLDIGSGNGSPGLVLALLRADLEATLLEPRRKRWAFLREAARAAGRQDVAVRAERHDAWRGAPCRSVSLRGLRLPAADLVRLLAPGGRLYVFGTPPMAAPGLVPEPGPGGVTVLRRA